MTKKQKKKKLTLTIDISNPKEYKIPKNMQIWDKDKPMSEKCVKLIEELSTIIAYVSKRLNEGPEVKKNIAKRTLVLKALTQLFLMNTFVDNFHRYGILRQVEVDIMDRQRVPSVMLLQPKKPKDGEKKKRSYIA